MVVSRVERFLRQEDITGLRIYWRVGISFIDEVWLKNDA